jgi:hypothetical protein
MYIYLLGPPNVQSLRATLVRFVANKHHIDTQFCLVPEIAGIPFQALSTCNVILSYSFSHFSSTRHNLAATAVCNLADIYRKLYLHPLTPNDL